MPNLLIVDDEPACRTPLRRLLEMEGYETSEAGDGLEALQRLGEGHPDLVLLDILMPRLDGVGFLERMRADSRYKELPVFLVTAVHDPRLLNRAKELGIQEYMFKGDVPFSRMLESIKKTLHEPYNPIRRGRRPKKPQANPVIATPAKVVVVWDPNLVDEQSYTELVGCVGDIVRAEGGTGIKRVREREIDLRSKGEVL
jgi:two-component system, chemotaxis family, chemotaxis protein CheY